MLLEIGKGARKHDRPEDFGLVQAKSPLLLKYLKNVRSLGAVPVRWPLATSLPKDYLVWVAARNGLPT